MQLRFCFPPGKREKKSLMKIPSDIIKKRLERLRGKMASHSVAVFYSGKNSSGGYAHRTDTDFLYLTGLDEEDIYFIVPCDDPAVLLRIPPDEKARQWTGEKMSNPEVAEFLGIPVSHVVPPVSLEDVLQKNLKNKKTLIFPFGKYPDMQWDILRILQTSRANARSKIYAPSEIIHTDTLMAPLRMIKEPWEMEQIKKASAISARAHHAVREWTQATHPRYEYEIRAFLEYEFYRHGADGLAYPSIVASGNNATFLHYPHYDGEIQKTDLVLIDAGCETNGYASDITRTFPVSGEASPEQSAVLEIVRRAHDAAIAEAVPGATLDAVHERAVRIIAEGLWDLGQFQKIPDPENPGKMISPSGVAEVIEKEYYKLFYMHRTSHFMGMDVHDSGIYYNEEKPVVLSPGMVFTVEPGIYLSRDLEYIPPEYRGIGVRLEDDVFIHEKGSEILTRDDSHL